MDYINLADRAVQENPEQPVLLGIRAEDPEVEYGWIEPAELIAPHPGIEVRRVRCFLEKPDYSSACAERGISGTPSPRLQKLKHWSR